MSGCVSCRGPVVWGFSVDRLIVVASVPYPEARTRLSKLAGIIDGNSWAAEWWCWSRHRAEDPNHREDVRTLLRGGGRANRWLALWYPVWMIRVFFAAIFAHRRAVFYCVSFDTAFPVALASSIKGTRYLFDNADNISISYRWPASLQRGFSRLEQWIASGAEIHVVPNASRWKREDRNLRVLPNFPSRSAVEAASLIARDKGHRHSRRVTLYVNGLLASGRGIPVLVRAMKLVNEENIELLVAGRPACPEARELIDMPNVQYLGVLANVEALAVYFRADVVLACYDPSLEINRLAEPNKWWDCVATGTPFITNEEVITAAPFVDAGACLTFPYFDHVQLADLLNSLSEKPDLLEGCRRGLASIPIADWGDEMSSILRELLD